MTGIETPSPRVADSSAANGAADRACAGWPREVDLVISAMRAAKDSPTPDRRRDQRIEYRAKASLRLFSDEPYSAPRTIYTCDANERGIGFVSRQCLPLSHGGILEIIAPNDQVMSVHCTLYRCSQIAPRWYRGALVFNRPQPAFDPLDYRAD